MKYEYKIFMNTIITVLLITAALFVVNTTGQAKIRRLQGRPAQCIGHPDLLLRFCCALPPFFTRDVARKCGGIFEMLDLKFNVTKIRRYNYNCRYWYCVLDQYGLITERAEVDHEKFFTHLDLWVTLNPSFTDVMIEAKIRCKQLFRYYLPIRVCQFSTLSMCFRNYLNTYCPVIVPTPECQEQQQFFKKCGKYFA